MRRRCGSTNLEHERFEHVDRSVGKPKKPRNLDLEEMVRESYGLVRGYLKAHRDEIDVADLDLAAFVLVTVVEALTHAAVLRRPDILADGEARHFVDDVTRLVVRYLRDAEAGTHATSPMRKVPIDAMRAVSMLYIVGFWHLLDYTKVATWHCNPVTYRLTVGALSFFVLISGFLTGRQDGDLARGEIWRFYKTRFWRIYLPFVIASGLFLAAGVSDALALFKGVTLVAMLLSPPPFTPWFVNMIVLFYLIAPLLIGLRGNEAAYVALCTVIVGAMVMYQAETGKIDMRLILYFPCFAAGIFLAARSLPSSTLSLIGLSLLAALSLVSTLARASWKLEGDPWSAPWALFGSIAVFVVVMRAGRNLKPPAILMQFSEASFFMYLLHCPLYLWIQNVWFPSTEKAQVPYLLFVCLPIRDRGMALPESLHRIFATA